MLISIFELGSKVSKNVTTETVTTEIFGGVSVVTSLLSHRIVTNETSHDQNMSSLFW